jgi:sterol desaturase/sphingolipid hydroxylase (fatty acid hydroxylase superfamily)
VGSARAASLSHAAQRPEGQRRKPFGLAVSSYQHCNIRFNTPKWWFKIFNTTEHHSLHHAQDYESTRSNYSGTWIFIDRIHGTCKDGEAELLGQEGGRRMSVWETLHYTFTEPYKLLRTKFARRRSQPPMVAVPAE